MKISWQEALEAAEKRNGLNDWGGEHFIEGLREFTLAINDEEGVPAHVRSAAKTQTDALLDQRLELYRDRYLYPEIPEQRIDKPLIIAGLPRSGTTLLHSVLAQDPRSRSPLTWEVDNPSPPPRRETYDTDPRIEICRKRIDAIPIEFKRMHLFGETLPEECNAITTLSFQSTRLWAPYRIPSYMEWYLASNHTAQFELHKHVLQHFQAFCPGEWWVLKSPPHIHHLQKIIQVYPDARIIFTHRDPAPAIASISSVFAYMRQHGWGPEFNHEVGEEMLKFWGEGLRRAFRDRNDPALREHFFDVNYDDLRDDPLAVVRSIYEHFSIDMSSDAEGAMARFVSDKPKDKLGRHIYQIEDYGLTADKIRDAVSAYMKVYFPELLGS